MLQPGGQAAGGQMTKEEAAKQAARVEGIKAKFAEGATLSNDGKYDEAIAKFKEVLVDVPKCTECYLNIGSVYAQKKEYDKSEEAYKKVARAQSRVGRRVQRPRDDLQRAEEVQRSAGDERRGDASARRRGAAAPANADALYNQGVIAWNANDFAKAQEQLRRRDRGQAESRRIALHARQGLPEPRQAARRRQGVRDLHEDRAERPEREGSGSRTSRC